MTNFDCVDRSVSVMKKMKVKKITTDEYVRYQNNLARNYPKEFTPIRRGKKLSLRPLLSQKNNQVKLFLTYDRFGKCTQKYILK